MTIISFSSMMEFAVADNMSFFSGPSIGKTVLCVKGKMPQHIVLRVYCIDRRLMKMSGKGGRMHGH